MFHRIRMARRSPFVTAAALAFLLQPAFGAEPKTAAPPQSPAPTPSGEAHGPEVGGTAQAFLTFVQKGSEEALRGAPGLSKPVVDKLLKHRSSGGTFRNLIEFRRVTGISSQDLELAMSPYAKIDQGL